VTAVVMEEPRPAVRAGALGPVLRALLVKDPGQRWSAAEAEAALTRIVTPQAEPYVRTQTDLGSQPPWAAVQPPPGPPPLDGHRPHTEVLPPQSGHRRGRSHALRAVLACGLGLLLALGGVWYAMADRSSDGGGGSRGARQPYGETVGLTRALRDDDCVIADWPGSQRFRGTPRLRLDPTCATAPDGQVTAFAPAASADEARRTGVVECEERTRETRARLADARSQAVVPTDSGFEAAGRRTACLVLGGNGPLYGPIGSRRRMGSGFADTATMQRRDCLDVRTNRDARLVSCAGSYDEQVLAFTRLAPDVTLSEARTESDTACARDVPPGDYGFDPSVYTAGSWTSAGPWKNGTHFVVCTVRRQNGGTMEGDES
jgi:eukaryotic-like serine/threonine-protein kinase